MPTVWWAPGVGEAGIATARYLTVVLSRAAGYSVVEVVTRVRVCCFYALGLASGEALGLVYGEPVAVVDRGVLAREKGGCRARKGDEREKDCEMHDGSLFTQKLSCRDQIASEFVDSR